MLRILLVSYFKEVFIVKMKLKPLTEKIIYVYYGSFKNYSERGREGETEVRTMYSFFPY